MNEEDERRMIALESRLAHHERMAEELSQVVAEQGRKIDQLTRQSQRLVERLREVEAGWEGSPQDDNPPPHY
jgi:SlyX protein